jgi:hypothetical protein
MLHKVTVLLEIIFELICISFKSVADLLQVKELSVFDEQLIFERLELLTYTWR